MGIGGGRQIYITSIFAGTGAWAGEVMQCGWRLGAVPATGVPSPGSIFTPTVTNASDDSISIGSDATWDWTRFWAADYGGDTWSDTENLGVAAAILTYWNAVKANFVSLFSLTQVKIALIDSNGKYQYPSTVYALKTPVSGGGATSERMGAPEISVATTLRAPILGRRGRGRWYSPPPNFIPATSSDGKVAAAFRTALSNAGKTLVDSYNGITTGWADFRLVTAVASATSATMVRPTQVRVGDHFDAQRRRQHQVAQAYTSVNL